ncbi:MAG TPA: AmmeMemoRadiSam system protein A [Spirochaetota bacterium]|nr:AmmeMemoRadiSam system protein A [Spirochaetota bacterium]
MEDKEKIKLLQLARGSIKYYLENKNKAVPDVKSLNENFKKKQGCFVTLNINSKLRGCIGNIMPQQPLYQAVIDNAVSAACQDPRFPLLSLAELKRCDIEISILSIPEVIEHTGPQQLLKKITRGKDGIILELGSRKSTFLPQVWEKIPDKTAFMQQLCLKQRADKNAWQSPEAVVSRYNAEAFSEQELLQN